jgi:hypothetical protein
MNREALAAPATVAAGAVSAGVLLAVLVASTPPRAPSAGGSLAPVLFIGAAWLTFVAGALLVRRLPARQATVIILAGAAVLPLAAAFVPPRSSDDLYRYRWDGRVQAAGISPYRYPPASAELVSLREESLWPQRAPWCVTGYADPTTGRPVVPGCTLINRPYAPTIYPPVAEAYFLVVYAVSPHGGRHVPFQLAAAVFAMAVTVLLLVGLRRVRGDPRNAVWWAWCPTVAYEAGSNAHVDVLAAFLTGLAVLCLARASSRRGSALGGVLLGLAIATKLIPALVAPALLRRRPVTVGLAAAGAVAAVYLPHVFVVGPAVVGYLPGYVNEEGYAAGSGFSLLSWFLPLSYTGPAAVAILFAVALLVTRAADPDRPWHAAATMTGIALVVAATDYPWYGLLLVLLVGFGARPEWLAVAAAGYLAQYANHLDLTYIAAQRIGYGGALAIVVLGWLIRRVPRPGAGQRGDAERDEISVVPACHSRSGRPLSL